MCIPTSRYHGGSWGGDPVCTTILSEVIMGFRSIKHACENELLEFAMRSRTVSYTLRFVPWCGVGQPAISMTARTFGACLRRVQRLMT